MEKKLYMLVTLVLISTGAVTAQDKTKASNSFSLQYGLPFMSRQDNLFSPMVYHSITPLNGGVFYKNENPDRLHQAEIFFARHKARWHDDYKYITGTGESLNQTTSPTFVTVVAIRYGFLKTIQTSSNGSWSAGGFSDNQINAVDNVYGGFGTFGYLGQFSLAPAVRREFFIEEKHTVTLSAWTALLSWISRSPYALNDDEYMQNNADHNGVKTFFRYVGDGQVQTVNHFQKLNFDAMYDFRFAERWKAGAAYRLEFLRSTKPKTLTTICNSINLQITYSF